MTQKPERYVVLDQEHCVELHGRECWCFHTGLYLSSPRDQLRGQDAKGPAATPSSLQTRVAQR